jgi:hypothetical protein
MADVIVPYDVLRFGDSNSLVNAISALLPKALTSSEIDLIHSAINQYTRSQNLLMLRNPKQYYLDTKKYCAPLMK